MTRFRLKRILNTIFPALKSREFYVYRNGYGTDKLKIPEKKEHLLTITQKLIYCNIVAMIFNLEDNMRKLRFVSALFLALIMVIALCLPTTAAVDPSTFPDYTKTGISFTAADQIQTSWALTAVPNTIEAWIKLPANLPDDTPGGVIFGNGGGDKCPVVSLEIGLRGNPVLVWTSEATHGISVCFGSVDLRIGKWVHLAVTRDPASGNLTCYVNGEAKETVQSPNNVDIIPDSVPHIGGDYTPENSKYFRGEISNLVVYPTARTADNITSKDMKTPDIKTALCFYMLNNKTDGLQDRSMSKNHAGNGKMFFDYNPEPGTFSIAVIPDTQIVNDNYATLLPMIADWILERREIDNIKFVAHLGDITNTNSAKAWETAKATYSRFDGVIPYSLAPGNHDYVTSGTVRDTTLFNQYFPIDVFKENGVYGGAYDETKSENVYFCFEVYGIKYLIMSLELGPRNDVLRWANEVCAAHPDYNVIVFTHAYMNNKCEHITVGDQYVPTSYSFIASDCNNGDTMWDKFVSKQPNITMVVSGHINTANILKREIKGDAGNTIVEVLCDIQDLDTSYGGVGAVMMLTFSNGGKTADVSFYSTIKEKYFKETNQFEMNLSIIGTEVLPETAAPETMAIATEAPETTEPVKVKRGCGSVIGFYTIITAIAAFSTAGRKRRR